MICILLKRKILVFYIFNSKNLTGKTAYNFNINKLPLHIYSQFFNLLHNLLENHIFQSKMIGLVFENLKSL